MSLRRYFLRRQWDRERARELEAHLAHETDDNRARGLPPEEARRQAHLKLGNSTRIREEIWRMNSFVWIENLARDLRYASRRLLRSPGFVTTVVLSLTVSIAANLVVLGVLRSILAGPSGIAASSRLFMVEQKPQGYTAQSYPDYQDLKARNTVFTDMLACRIGQAGVTAQGFTRKSWDYEVSGNYFDMLGVRPQLGRLFHASDEHGPNSAPSVVLSEGFWRSRFNANPRVIGTSIALNKHLFTVIGVAPAAFHGTESLIWPDFWYPMVDAPEVNGYSYLQNRFNHTLSLLGRLKPGVTPQQATENLNAIAARMAKEYPQTDGGYGARLVKPGLFGDEIGDAAQEYLSGILLLSLLTLAAACVNLASIFAARSADRAREHAVRIAIGAGRWRVLRQIAAEATLLAAGGGMAGVLAASWLLRMMSTWQPIPGLPLRLAVEPNALVYAAAVLLAAASATLPALLTSRQIWRIDPMLAIKAGSAQPRMGRVGPRDLLLGLQVTLCALLITCALVGLRGLQRSLETSLGFRPHGVTLGQTQMKMTGFTDSTGLPLQKKLLEQAARIPGVSAAGSINEIPLDGGGSTTPIYRTGTTDFRSSSSITTAKYFTISPGYLRAAETRLMAGRNFTWHDDQHSPPVVLINETLAHRLFGDQSALGQTFTQQGTQTLTVVGVVADGKYDSLGEAPRSAMFFPLAQNPDDEFTLIVRSPRPTREIAAALRSLIANEDPSLPVFTESWPDALSLVLFPARAATVALGVLGALAAMLAVTGIFGMASYTVAQRLRELGLRVALGAQRSQVLRAAMGRTVLLLGVGALVGLALGVAASKVLASIVYTATAYDPAVLGGAMAIMTLIGAAASLVPARRAVQVDPALLLRQE